MSDIVTTNKVELPVKMTGVQMTLSDVDNALAKVSESFEIHNHSHTQFTWKLYNLSHYGDARNIRQVTAELTRTKAALTENKYRYLKKLAKMEIKIATADMTTPMRGTLGPIDIAKQKLLNLEIEEMKEGTEGLRVAYEGAMKDVMVLTKIYHDLKQRIIDKYGKCDEEVLELEEKKYWIRRLFAQAAREVRQDGRIHTGNQEALEQIGLNVTAVLSAITEYLKEESKLAETKMDNPVFYSWLDFCADHYCNSYQHVLLRNGINETLDKEGLTTNGKLKKQITKKGEQS